MRTMAAWVRRSKRQRARGLVTERARPRWCARLAGSGSCSLVLGTEAAPNVCLATLASVLLLDASSYHPPIWPTLKSCPCPLLDPSLRPVQRQPDRKPNKTGGMASLHAAWSRLVGSAGIAAGSIEKALQRLRYVCPLASDARGRYQGAARTAKNGRLSPVLVSSLACIRTSCSQPSLSLVAPDRLQRPHRLGTAKVYESEFQMEGTTVPLPRPIGTGTFGEGKQVRKLRSASTEEA